MIDRERLTWVGLRRIERLADNARVRRDAVASERYWHAGVDYAFALLHRAPRDLDDCVEALNYLRFHVRADEAAPRIEFAWREIGRAQRKLRNGLSVEVLVHLRSALAEIRDEDYRAMLSAVIVRLAGPKAV